MKISKETFKKIIKEEIAKTLNEGRDVMDVYMAKGNAIPFAGTGDVVVVNKVYTGRDGNEYVRYSVYRRGAPIFIDNRPDIDTVVDAAQRGYKSHLNSGMSGEVYVVSAADLEANARKI